MLTWEAEQAIADHVLARHDRGIDTLDPHGFPFQLVLRECKRVVGRTAVFAADVSPIDIIDDAIKGVPNDPLKVARNNEVVAAVFLDAVSTTRNMLHMTGAAHG